MYSVTSPQPLLPPLLLHPLMHGTANRKIFLGFDFCVFNTVTTCVFFFVVIHHSTVIYSPQ
jgi:hypothetical protein